MYKCSLCGKEFGISTGALPQDAMKHPLFAHTGIYCKMIYFNAKLRPVSKSIME